MGVILGKGRARGAPAQWRGLRIFRGRTLGLLLLGGVLFASPVAPGLDPASPMRLGVQSARAEEASAAPNATDTDASTGWIALIARVSTETGVPAEVLRALVEVESGGNAAAVNPETGAIGLTMITPDITQAQGTRIEEMGDPRVNVRAAADYLVNAKARWGTWDLAVAEWEGLIDGSGTAQAIRHRRGSADFGFLVRYKQALHALNPDEATISDRAKALGYGLEAVGMPYLWGGASLEAGGFDCSGLVYWAYKQLGKELPRTSEGQWAGTVRIDASEAQPGDLVFFADTFGSGISHLGMYAGNGYFLHSQTEGTPVQVSSLNDPYWSAHLAGFGRVP